MQQPMGSSPRQSFLVHIDEEWIIWRYQHVQPHVKLELCKQKNKKILVIHTDYSESLNSADQLSCVCNNSPSISSGLLI